MSTYSALLFLLLCLLTLLLRQTRNQLCFFFFFHCPWLEDKDVFWSNKVCTIITLLTLCIKCSGSFDPVTWAMWGCFKGEKTGIVPETDLVLARWFSGWDSAKTPDFPLPGDKVSSNYGIYWLKRELQNHFTHVGWLLLHKLKVRKFKGKGQEGWRYDVNTVAGKESLSNRHYHTRGLCLPQGKRGKRKLGLQRDPQSSKGLLNNLTRNL